MVRAAQLRCLLACRKFKVSNSTIVIAMLYTPVHTVCVGRFYKGTLWGNGEVVIIANRLMQLIENCMRVYPKGFSVMQFVGL